MSSTITWLIVGTLVIALSWAVAKGVWSAVKKYRVVIQIVLFLILMLCVARVFFTKENFEKLHDSVEKTGIGERMEDLIMSSIKGKSENINQKAEKLPRAEDKAKDEVVKPVEAKAVETKNCAAKPVVSAPVVASPDDVKVDVSISVKESNVPMKPCEDIDSGKYDKGIKSFTYALPFSAKVSMSVRDGAYRLMAESRGRLDESEKKEIGKHILKSIAAYSGEEVQIVDKNKISIDVKYDGEASRTQVFMIVPFTAIERQ